MHKINIRHVVIVLSCIFLIACGSSQSARTELGKKILADTTLFPNLNAQGINKIIDDFQKNGNYSNFSGPVNEPQPSIEDITKKYGKADEVVSKEVSVPFWHSFTVYYYGDVGFGVVTDVEGNKVTTIFVGK